MIFAIVLTRGLQIRKICPYISTVINSNFYSPFFCFQAVLGQLISGSHEILCFIITISLELFLYLTLNGQCGPDKGEFVNYSIGRHGPGR